ncbi:hypothetical protein D8Y22_00965 [Salinadaptatus halalkaliphilus]|uniref:Uncharacterized protein n=1 Tax=Salinadaptatus halalkaliphilus TaxID=2419781 RepID=A0A4S3TQY8_9EURY|nr:hypothetical protein [Salinadaptatus halalkaliphilus]THE66726.1 hypothetical protein D8Y22_00965 [Salinadaptatus halalkaliphilus]
MHDSDDSPSVTRRRLLRASAVTIGASAVGTGQASANPDGALGGALERDCPDATLRPSMGHCRGASFEGCANDHPATLELQAAVEETLTERYPDAGALAEAGFKPYFDTLDLGDEDGWSHWLSPDYIGDDAVLDPARPESVLVDNDSWRSIGVMFIATRGGEPIEAPPVYEAGDDGFEVPDAATAAPIDVTADGPGHDHHGDGHHDEQPPTDHGDHHDGHDHDGHDPDDHHDGHHSGDGEGHSEGNHDHSEDGHGHSENGHGHDHPDGDPDRCSPWHYHAGLPGRFAWWFYQQVYGRSYADGDLELPCRTPCMMHVWTVDHPEGVYAHDGPPAASRDYPPADDPDLETDAEPGEDTLSWETLPDDLEPDRRPEELSWLGPF